MFFDRFVSPYCLAYPCPSVIYVKFPGEGHAIYGGYYVIDGILPRYVNVIKSSGRPGSMTVAAVGRKVFAVRSTNNSLTRFGENLKLLRNWPCYITNLRDLGNLSRVNQEGVLRQNGAPRYRHLHKPFWFLPMFLRDQRLECEIG